MSRDCNPVTIEDKSTRPPPWQGQHCFPQQHLSCCSYKPDVNTQRLSLGVPLLILAGALSGCGGVSSSSNGTANLPTSGPTGSSAPAGNPIIVQVASGATAAGINITVPAPASSPPPNAQVLGVTTGTGGSAFNTGQVIARGANATVLLFGPGLDGSMTVTIGGPTDIQVSNVRSIKATDGTTGVAFNAVVSGNAALGARTVFLQDTKGDITAFSGGLEVTP